LNPSPLASARHIDIEGSKSATAKAGNESVCCSDHCSAFGRSGRGTWVGSGSPNRTNPRPHRPPRRPFTGSGRDGRAVNGRCRGGLEFQRVPVLSAAALGWSLGRVRLFHPFYAAQSCPVPGPDILYCAVPEDLRQSSSCQGRRRRAMPGQCNLYITWIRQCTTQLSIPVGLPEPSSASRVMTDMETEGFGRGISLHHRFRPD
jgi:hypothetical protein